MGRSPLILLTAVLSLTGCKQLFGPEDAGQGGAVNTGGAAAGAGGVGGSSTSSMSGGNSAGGGATGGAGTGGAECHFTPGTSASCQSTMTVGMFEAYTFASVNQAELDNDFLLEDCAHSGPDTCGTWTLVNENNTQRLRAIPAPMTGYWNDDPLRPAPLLYKQMNGAFVVTASVLVHDDVSGVDSWPDQTANLGGLLLRGTGATPTCRPPWMKLEVGTLDSTSAHGIRSAWQGLETLPADSPNIADDTTGFVGTPSWVDLALCRPNDGVVRRFYRISGTSAWTEVGNAMPPPPTAPLPTEMAGPVDIGLIAASYGTPEVMADFRYASFQEYESLCDCQERLPLTPLPE